MKYGPNLSSPIFIALNARISRAGFRASREERAGMGASAGAYWQDNRGMVFAKKCLKKRTI